MTSFFNVQVQSFDIYISVAPHFLSYVLLSIFQLGVFSIFHRPHVIVCLEKHLDVEHGLPNVLTEAVWVLRVQKCERRFEWEQKNEKWCVTLLQSHGVRAGELAGDVECDQIFSNNYVRNAITIISHLQTDKNDC